MRAEILSIGDELITGQRLDTNSAWLSARLLELGIRAAFHTTVGDDLDSNVDAFRLAMERADVVVATGGLGPTADDLTRDALAAACDTELDVDRESLDRITALFARRGRPMPERNRVQALVPRGARPIPNPNGTAPGIELSRDRAGRTPVWLFALPGVPAEMIEMWHASVAPRLQSEFPRPRVWKHHVVKCFGAGESELEARLPDLIRRGRRPEVGITVSQATISLRIQAEGTDEGECDALIAETRAAIDACLGTLVFGTGDDELQHAVACLLQERRYSLAVHESGTQGRIASWFAEAGAPSVWRGAIVEPDSPGEADPGRPDAESERVIERARRCRDAFGADIGLAVGPWPANRSSSDGARIVFAVAARDGAFSQTASVAGHPDLVRTRAAKQALNGLRLWLLRETTSTRG